MTRYALDTGPLVAYLRADDDCHEWAMQTLQDLTPPLRTCEAVLSEACYLLREIKSGRNSVLEMIENGTLSVDFRLSDEIEEVRRLVDRYASVPMSLADACLVRMTETDPHLRIITLDSDFRIYRRLGRQAVPVLMPD
jgi:predicted nucleic acid-binding protein